MGEDSDKSLYGTRDSEIHGLQPNRSVVLIAYNNMLARFLCFVIVTCMLANIFCCV